MAVLYSSPSRSAPTTFGRSLSLSSGAVSMTLSELSRWGVDAKGLGTRGAQDFYAAEVQLWRMISRVFSEREKVEISVAIESFQEALAQVDKMRQGGDAKSRARAELQRERIGHLLELARLGARLLDALLSTAKLDAEPLVRFLLGRSPGSHSPGSP